jgi:hypothetical protein
MNVVSEFSVRPISLEGLEGDERHFAELASALIEKVVLFDEGEEGRKARTERQKGWPVGYLGGMTHWREDFGLFLKSLDTRDGAQDEDVQRELVQPLREIWEEHEGAPGIFKGTEGTCLDVERIRIGENQGDYKLMIYGVDRI